MIFLQDRSYKMADDETRKTELFWMPTLRISYGSHVHSLDLRRQLNISVGGYFMLAQVLGFTQSLLSLDLSGNGLRADEAGVLAMGLYSNRSLKVTLISISRNAAIVLLPPAFDDVVRPPFLLLPVAWLLVRICAQ